jgi:hypothetical protein
LAKAIKSRIVVPLYGVFAYNTTHKTVEKYTFYAKKSGILPVVVGDNARQRQITYGLARFYIVPKNIMATPSFIVYKV